MHRILTALHVFAAHPITNLCVAMVLIGSSLLELGDQLFHSIASGQIESQHGVLLFGFAQAMRSLPEVVEGIERLFHGPEAELP